MVCAEEHLGRHRAHSAVVSPRVQKQIQRIRAKAKAQLSEPMVLTKAEESILSRPVVNDDRAHLDDSISMSPSTSENGGLTCNGSDGYDDPHGEYGGAACHQRFAQ